MVDARIGAMANVDKRLLDILRKLARGSWSYDNVEGRLELAGMLLKVSHLSEA